MDKKDIYEHLAKIYLASAKRRRHPPKNKTLRTLSFAGIIVLFGLSVGLFATYNKNSSLKAKPAITKELALILQPDIVKINFNFNPAKKEVYSLNLNNLNLRQFKTLGFSARKANFDDKIILKIEFTNAVNESSEYYIAELISYRWRDYKIALPDFKLISDWSKILNLSFIVEDSTTKEQKGIVYLDNIRLLR